MNVNTYSGRVTADIELKMTAQGTPFAKFTIAVKRPYSKDKTDFFNCEAWGHNAEFVCKYFKKGSPILVHGYMTTSKYEDRETGKKVTAYEVKCESIEFFMESQPNNTAKTEMESDGLPAGNTEGLSEEYFSDIRKCEEDLPF